MHFLNILPMSWVCHNCSFLSNLALKIQDMCCGTIDSDLIKIVVPCRLPTWSWLGIGDSLKWRSVGSLNIFHQWQVLDFNYRCPPSSFRRKVPLLCMKSKWNNEIHETVKRNFPPTLPTILKHQCEGVYSLNVIPSESKFCCKRTC